MTISSTNRKAGPYRATGAQTAFPFTFKVFGAGDMLVVLTDLTGVEAVQTLTTDYTVALNADQNTAPGGTIRMLAAPLAGYLVTVGSAVPATQGQSIPNNGGFYPKVIEQALDKLTIGVQQMAESLSRSLKFAFSDTVSGTLPPAAQRANGLLGFDSAGNPIMVGLQVAPERPVQIELRVAAAGQTVFDLAKISYTPGIGSMHVYVDGFRASSGYNETSRTSVTFAKGLPAGTEVLFEAGSAANSQLLADAVLLPYKSAAGVASNVAAKLGEVVSVKDFGAKGDGITDDTAAFQATYASLPASGGSIFIPPGTYVCAEYSLHVKKSNVHIYGAGRGVTIIKTKGRPTGNQVAPVYFAHYNDASVRGTVNNCSLRDLTIDGNFANQYQGVTTADGQCSGLRIEDIDGMLVADVEARNCDGYGFSMVGTNLPHRKNITFIRCYSHDNAYDGYDIKGGAQGVRLQGCRSDDNGIIGSIPGRDSMGFDLRGEDVSVVDCQGSGSISGNFRVRESAGLGVRLTNCTSRNAPVTGYGFHLIGTNLGITSLIGCLSIGDYTSFRYRRGHARLVNCMSYGATGYGFHLEEDAPATMATTTGAIAMAVRVTAIFSVDSTTNIAVGEFVRVSDGSAYVEGAITAINGLAVSLYVTSNQGAGPVAAGAALTVRNIGSFTATGCHATFAGIDGWTIQSLPFQVTLTDCESMFNSRYGANCLTTDLRLMRCKLNNNVRGINFLSMAGKAFYMDDSEVTDDQTDKSQTYAFVWDGASVTCTGAVRGSALAGNLTGVNSGAVPAGVLMSQCTGVAPPAITGSRGGNAALASVLTQLAAYGLITDSTTA